MEKTAAAKRLGTEKNISVGEAKRRLDTNLFLDEIPKWEPGRPHCSFLFQRMFAQTEVTGWKEYDWGICRGHQQPLPERDIQAKIPAMELLTPESTWEEIMTLYYQVYHLKRNLEEVPCSKDIAEETHLEILEMLKAHLQHRQGPAQPEGLGWSTRTTRMPAQADFHAQMQVTCDHFGHFRDRQQESQEEALRVVSDAHCLALAWQPW